jgi:hypothetical protein
MESDNPIQFPPYPRDPSSIRGRAFDEPYVTKTGKVLSDADIEKLSEEAERGYDVERLMERFWFCRKRFTVEYSGPGSGPDLEAELALYEAGIRRSPTPGEYRWSATVGAETAADAALVSRNALLELLRPYGVEEIVVVDSAVRLIR